MRRDLGSADRQDLREASVGFSETFHLRRIRSGLIWRAVSEALQRASRSGTRADAEAKGIGQQR